ncbi:hypothetical protein PDN31_16275 [Bacillus cereus]|nr:hypothetical protein [Bacillus cereus]MDA2133526.1 hypothetical protein [Bacillus cereus]
MNIFKGVILDIDLQVSTRPKVSRKAEIIEDFLKTGNRKPALRQGYILTNTVVANDNSNTEIVVPRQEPLEYSWKKMNT